MNYKTFTEKLIQDATLEYELVVQPEFAFAQGNTTVANQAMFGAVVPYQTRCEYSIATSCIYTRVNVKDTDRVLIDQRILEAGSCAGIRPIYWPDLDWALKLGLPPFKTGPFSNSYLNFTWVEVAQKSIAYIGEAWQPPLAPVWLKLINYNKWMYIAKLAAFWQSISQEYVAASWDDEARVNVVDPANPTQALKGALGLTL